MSGALWQIINGLWIWGSSLLENYTRQNYRQLWHTVIITLHNYEHWSHSDVHCSYATWRLLSVFLLLFWSCLSSGYLFAITLVTTITLTELLLDDATWLARLLWFWLSWFLSSALLTTGLSSYFSWSFLWSDYIWRNLPEVGSWRTKQKAPSPRVHVLRFPMQCSPAYWLLQQLAMVRLGKYNAKLRSAGGGSGFEVSCPNILWFLHYTVVIFMFTLMN